MQNTVPLSYLQTITRNANKYDIQCNTLVQQKQFRYRMKWKTFKPLSCHSQQIC